MTIEVFARLHAFGQFGRLSTQSCQQAQQKEDHDYIRLNYFPSKEKQIMNYQVLTTMDHLFIKR